MGDIELYEAARRQANKGRCRRCGERLNTKDGRVKYCPSCKAYMKAEKEMKSLTRPNNYEATGMDEPEKYYPFK